MKFPLNENPEGVELTRSHSHERSERHEECDREPCAVCGCKAHKPWHAKADDPEPAADEPHPHSFLVFGERVFLCAEHQRFTEPRLRELLAAVQAAPTPAARAKIVEAHRGPMATHKPVHAVAARRGRP
jgi:hypothetical protein